EQNSSHLIPPHPHPHPQPHPHTHQHSHHHIHPQPHPHTHPHPHHHPHHHPHPHTHPHPHPHLHHHTHTHPHIHPHTHTPPSQQPLCPVGSGKMDPAAHPVLFRDCRCPPPSISLFSQRWWQQWQPQLHGVSLLIALPCAYSSSARPCQGTLHRLLKASSTTNSLTQ